LSWPLLASLILQFPTRLEGSSLDRNRYMCDSYFFYAFSQLTLIKSGNSLLPIVKYLSQHCIP
jgi:hypothetical protein